MPQASPNYNLYVLKPNLVKEWHPTKNAPLKPQEITPGSGKKIWWICSEGHEWQAAVYSRNRGSGCPYCALNGSGITVSGSPFITEWHPTANAHLNPAEWATGNSTRVWWICRKGHEWQATFKSRFNGKGCPVCDQLQTDNARTRYMEDQSDDPAAGWLDSTPEKESLESIFGTDSRRIKRYRTKATVTIKVPSTNDFFYAQMRNFSHEGMCLEASTSLSPGTKIVIKLDQSVFKSSQKIFDSIIKWCEGLRDDDGVVYNFGMGIQFI
jgi:hypothetical protein